jgi:hypothetical protein
MIESSLPAPGETSALPDPRTFNHREHVRAAFELLTQHSFDEATYRFSWLVRQLAQRAGKPDIFNQTITVAFLSVIAERMTTQGCPDFAAFEAGNPDVLSATLLHSWYRPERLRSELARRVFILPDRLP